MFEWFTHLSRSGAVARVWCVRDSTALPHFAPCLYTPACRCSSHGFCLNEPEGLAALQGKPSAAGRATLTAFVPRRALRRRGWRTTTTQWEAMHVHKHVSALARGAQVGQLLHMYMKLLYRPMVCRQRSRGWAGGGWGTREDERVNGRSRGSCPGIEWPLSGSPWHPCCYGCCISMCPMPGDKLDAFQEVLVPPVSCDSDLC